MIAAREFPLREITTGWLEQKEKRVRQEQSESEARQRAMARELEWVRSSAKARQAKSKARLAAYDEMVNQQEREKQSFATIQIPPGPRLGNVVIEVEGLEKEFGDKVLFKGLTFKLPPNGIVGIIGPNGAGKSTLFKLITGQETPDAGKIRLGETVKLAYVDQSRDDLAPTDTVWQAISGGLDIIKVGNREIVSRSYVGSFNFKGGDQQKKVGLLSGGETQSRPSRQDPGPRAATSSCSTNLPTTSTSRRCKIWRMPWSNSRAAPWSSATIVGFSIACAPTSSPSKATAMSSGSKATSSV